MASNCLPFPTLRVYGRLDCKKNVYNTKEVAPAVGNNFSNLWYLHASEQDVDDQQILHDILCWVVPRWQSCWEGCVVSAIRDESDVW
jgi:hypothetical protein